MLQKKVLNYDHESGEADIIVSDGEFSLLCYSQPFSDDEPIKLYGLFTQNVMRSLDNEMKVEKDESSYYGYKLQGKIVNLKQRLVAIGEIIIELENCIPQDIQEGEFVEFEVTRIDY